MIPPINFMGRVFYAGSTKKRAEGHPNEKKELSKYARRNNCDVIVLDRDYYSGDKGKYQTIAVKESDYTGRNLFYKVDFDFQKDTITVGSANI